MWYYRITPGRSSLNPQKTLEIHMENNENNAPSRNYQWVAEGDNRPLDESINVLAHGQIDSEDLPGDTWAGTVTKDN